MSINNVILYCYFNELLRDLSSKNLDEYILIQYALVI